MKFKFIFIWSLVHLDNIKLSTRGSKFSKIMVAIDGSEHSLKAAQHALDIAKSFSAPLYAVTVTYVPESYHLKQEDVLNQSREMRDSMEDAKTWLEKFNQESKEDNVQLKTELINSHRPVDYIILEYAEKNNIDLIVIGTRGRSGFKKLLLGSIASSVVTYAHCPVMVVK
jgi:nucleotide-binding universal stress UspA family protein